MLLPPHQQEHSRHSSSCVIKLLVLPNYLTAFLQGIKRTSNLLAPIMQLLGHGGDVLGLSFSPDGQNVASCSFDRTILLWRTYDECENYMMLRGHKNAVTQVRAQVAGEATAAGVTWSRGGYHPTIVTLSCIV